MYDVLMILTKFMSTNCTFSLGITKSNQKTESTGLKYYSLPLI